MADLSKELSKDFAYCEDAVSRKAAIDALYNVDEYNGRSVEAIRNLPSARPEKRTEKRTETHACDLIDRQAAIDAIYHHLPSVSRTRARTMLHEVPSAQPENQVHLCDSCRHVYPECPSEKDDVIFGNGKGNDNICACNKYEPSAQPEIIRCKDCIYYDPPHVENNGVRYEYDEMPADAFDALGTGLVNAEYGINIGGRCCVDYYCKHYSDDKRVFVREDNYCGRAERKTECCPVCGRTLGVSQFVKTQTGFRVGDPYCKRCGQAIDWKEGE